MELREIGIDDVYPDEKNPRKDFGDIAALAESCMLNALNPGEPVNPIVVVEDGGIYRIVDGERRYKAMCKNKLARCHAVVCDDMDEANAMVAMVATDDKRPLTDVERSRGVQQMLLLGVDPERVERAGRMPKGAAAKLRRARAAVDDAGDDMTLDRMLAIAEFEELGDGAAVEKLTSCREGEWRDVAKAERQRMQRDERRAALVRACEDAGVAISEKRLYSQDGWSWCEDVKDPDALAQAVAGIDGCAAYIIESGTGPEIELCKPVASDEERIDPEQVERMRRIDEVRESIETAKAAHLSWFDERIEDLESMPRVMEMIEDEALSVYNGIGQLVDSYEQAVGAEVDRRFCPMLAAYGYMMAAGKAELHPWISDALVDGRRPHYASNVERFLCWLDAFVADGYEPTEADIELKSLCEAALAHDEDEEE